MRFWRLSDNRSRQSRDLVNTVRDHRSAKPRSAGLVRSGRVPVSSTGNRPENSPILDPGPACLTPNSSVVSSLLKKKAL